jgi:hypothetical protein
MSAADFPGMRWRGHWLVPDVPEFAIDPTSVGSDLPPAEFSRAQFGRVFAVEDVPLRVSLRLSADSRYVLWVQSLVTVPVELLDARQLDPSVPRSSASYITRGSADHYTAVETTTHHSDP